MKTSNGSIIKIYDKNLYVHLLKKNGFCYRNISAFNSHFITK